LIYGDGEQTRDFVYVEDVAQAFVDAALSDDKVNNQTMNIICGVATSINTIVEMIGSITGRESQITYEQARPGDILHSYLNNSKAQELMSWSPNHDLHKGLKKTIAARLTVGNAVDH